MDIRERLGLVKSSLALLADRLRDDDTVSVVSFEDKATPILEPTPVSDTDAILEAIEELTPGGSTNLEAGLRLGYEQAREAFDPRRRQRRGARLRRRRQRRPHRPGLDRRQDRGGGRGRHPPGHRRLRHGQLQRPPDGAARRPAATASTPTSTTYEEAERLFGDGADDDADPGRGRGPGPGHVRPGRGVVVPADRLRQPGDRRRRLRRRRRSTPASSAPGHHATALYEVRLADGVEPGDRSAPRAVRWTLGADGGRAAGAIGRGDVGEWRPARRCSFDLAATGGRPGAAAQGRGAVRGPRAHRWTTSRRGRRRSSRPGSRAPTELLTPSDARHASRLDNEPTLVNSLYISLWSCKPTHGGTTWTPIANSTVPAGSTRAAGPTRSATSG